jgi:hypothetical protein
VAWRLAIFFPDTNKACSAGWSVLLRDSQYGCVDPDLILTQACAS